MSLKSPPLPDDFRLEYAMADPRLKYRVAAESPAKFEVLDQLMEKHSDDQVLIIGMYLEQLEKVEKRYGYPSLR
jgi:DNA excision repair protein ERCC-3